MDWLNCLWWSQLDNYQWEQPKENGDIYYQVENLDELVGLFIEKWTENWHLKNQSRAFEAFWPWWRDEANCWENDVWYATEVTRVANKWWAWKKIKAWGIYEG